MLMQLGGVAIGLQSPIVVGMGARVGPASASFIMHLGGAIASLILVGLRGGEMLGNWRVLPWYMLGCGIFGLLLLLSLAQTIPRFGVGTAIALLLLGQLATGLIVDHFGMFEAVKRSITLPKILGAGLVLAGAILMVRGG